ncbi:MAG: hypothetical protein LUH05_02420 [Candidatus Gastranaerophilales bacterium]|nr:hypothetical protein [Candidatus Gastranaerophilales bacterium]
MKKFFTVLFIALNLSLCAFADELQDVQCFFNQYIDAANSYSNDYFDYYSEDAKIVRVVEKPDGTKEAVNIPLSRYKEEAKKSTALMKLRKYKNRYLNVKIFPHGKDYKIVAMRMPSTSDYKIPAHFIVGKNDNGEWKIKEESMNTKVQKFLREG